jgi:hypothetical protein
MGNVSQVSVFASKVGKDLIAKIQNVQIIAAAMDNALSNQSIALVSASVTTVGAELLVSVSLSMQSSRSVQMIVQEMACVWMGCAHAMLDTKVQIAVILSARA